MRVCVDRRLCSGHAQCAATAPEIYTLDEEGFCSADGVEVPSHLVTQARLGALRCPEGAITLIEDELPSK